MAAFLTSKLGGIPVKVSLSREECFLDLYPPRFSRFTGKWA
ncbi:hypothetical protein ACLB1T_05515 [Escherichia coli]